MVCPGVADALRVCKNPGTALAVQKLKYGLILSDNHSISEGLEMLAQACPQVREVLQECADRYRNAALVEVLAA